MPTPEAKRQRKTPRQRAEEALAIAERRIATLAKKDKKLTAELTGVQRELKQAKVRRDYLAKSPDLPQQETRPGPAVPA
jgi:seryl-tRNA synthetase